MINPLRIPATIHNIGRARELATILIQYGFEELVIQTGLAERWFVRSVRRAEAAEGSAPERFAAMLERLGPSFIKLGQVLSTRADLLPDEWIQALSRLQDTVAPLDFERLRPIIIEACGPFEQTFSHFDETPLATASVGQVHAAVLRDGSEVVVKVVRPGMREQVMSDVQIMLVFAQLMEARIPELRAFRPTGVIREFERAIKAEMNLQREARNIERFRNNFADDDDVVVPLVYHELSNTDVLVMERIHGVKITDCAQIGADPVDVARRGLQVVLKMAFFHGFFHADPHPGNIWVVEGGKIALLDMGMADFVLPDTRDTMIDLLAAIATDDPDRLVQALMKMGELPIDLDRKAFRRDVLLIYEQYVRGAKLSDLNIGEILTASIETGRRHHVVIPTDITMLLKGLGTIEGIGKQLYPDLDLVTEVRPYVTRLVAMRWGPERLAKQFLSSGAQAWELLLSIPERSENLLQQIESGRFQTRSRIEGLDHYVWRLESVGNRIAAALLVLALTVAAATLWNEPALTWKGIPLLASAAGIGAVVIGVALLLGSLRKPRPPRHWT
ncbi:MAG: AarF/ABC1/UbiB kinase family protein [Candidatus Dadabacteria bacterium]|nr:MAG: AarF/ABC1/UbiB kinase family protein [Candidatus Dadabacteria bacterium]